MIIYDCKKILSEEKKIVRDIGLSPLFLTRVAEVLEVRTPKAAISFLEVNPAAIDLQERIIREKEGSRRPLNFNGSPVKFSLKPLSIKKKGEKRSFIAPFIRAQECATNEELEAYKEGLDKIGIEIRDLQFPLEHLIHLHQIGYIELMAVEPVNAYSEIGTVRCYFRNKKKIPLIVQGVAASLHVSPISHRMKETLPAEKTVKLAEDQFYIDVVPENREDQKYLVRSDIRENEKWEYLMLADQEQVLTPYQIHSGGTSGSLIPVLAFKEEGLIISDVDPHNAALFERTALDEEASPRYNTKKEKDRARLKDEVKKQGAGERDDFEPTALMGEGTASDFGIIYDLSNAHAGIQHGTTATYSISHHLEELAQTSQFPAIESGRYYCIVFHNGSAFIGDAKEILMAYYVLREFNVGFHMHALWERQREILGLIIGASVLIIQRKSRHTPIPFGPFIAIAIWLGIIWGFDLTQSYLHLFGITWSNI